MLLCASGRMFSFVSKARFPLFAMLQRAEQVSTESGQRVANADTGICDQQT
jgi:hypothetical protein